MPVRKTKKVRKYKKKYVRRYKRKYNKLRRLRAMGNNLQFIRLKKVIDYAVPGAEVSRGTYGVFAYPAVGSSSTTTQTYSTGSFDFRASDVPGISNYGSLFDMYRIIGVKLRFKYITSSISVPYNTDNPKNYTCQLMIWKDYDDVSTPTGTSAYWQEVEGSGRARTMRFPNRGNYLNVYVKPKATAPIVDSSGTTTARMIIGGKWFDGSTALDTEYQGLKWMARTPPSQTATLVHTFAVSATYYFQFKNRVK